VSRKSKLPMVLIAIAVLFLLACILCCGGVAIVLAF
jgi:hypothetical protein